MLRLHPLPPTILDVDPATTHLTVPESGRNFLISPPGSPPEGWQPILEDAPNAQTLADDLHRALQGLMLNGLRRDKGKEVILDGGEGGVRVEVEDTSMAECSPDVEEYVADEGSWQLPGHGQGGHGVRVAPTARPPI
jgi:calcipressin-2